MNQHPSRTTHARTRAGVRRGWLLAAVLAAALPLTGCGMNILARRSEPAGKSATAKPAKNAPKPTKPAPVAKNDAKAKKKSKDEDEVKAAKRGTNAEAHEHTAALPAEPS